MAVTDRKEGALSIQWVGQRGRRSGIETLRQEYREGMWNAMGGKR